MFEKERHNLCSIVIVWYMLENLNSSMFFSCLCKDIRWKTELV